MDASVLNVSKELNELQRKILKLKKEQNVLLLAHFYVDQKIQDIADFVGDSLYLAEVAKEMGNKFNYIIEAAVHFMAETIVILNPEKDVFLSATRAFCPMASMCPARVIDDYKKEYPGIPLALYVNTTAEAKTRADVICTSSNAVKICKKLGATRILFGPDKNLGLWVKKNTGIEIIPVPSNGYCYVHKMFTADKVKELKKAHPNAIVLAHPECTPDVLDIADQVGSTKFIYEFCKKSNNKEFIIATEKKMADKLNIELGPEKKFIPALETAICKTMDENSLENIYDILLNKPDKYKVILDSAIIEKSKGAIEKMFDLMSDN